MISLLPALTVRPFEQDDIDALLALIRQQLARSFYSFALDKDDLLDQLAQPHSHFMARWQSTRSLCAWRAGELVGFLDAAVGFDSVNLDQPDHLPRGFLRFIALTERSDIVNETLLVLLRAAEQFWLEQKVQYVYAFAPGMGYPQFQGGVGILPGDWDGVVRALTSLGYSFSQRFYLLRRPLRLLLEEDVPMTDLRLEYQRNRSEVRYRIFRRLVEQIATARVLALPEMQIDHGLEDKKQAEEENPSKKENRTLHLLDLFVAEQWRNHNVGKWLLRRVINDATMARYDELIAFPASTQAVALVLLGQQGFIEQNYRGYSLEKELAK